MGQSVVLRILFGLFVICGLGLYVSRLVEPQVLPDAPSPAPITARSDPLDPTASRPARTYMPPAGEAFRTSGLPTTGQPFSLPFPRLGMWWPDPWSQPVSDIARYDWVIFFPGQEAWVALAKQTNPALLALTATNACEVSFNPDPEAGPQENAEARLIPAEWYLTQVGTQLSEAVNATSTILRVAEVAVSNGVDSFDLFTAGDTALIGGESVYVQAVNRANKTLTVQRGYVRPAAAHPAGTRIAAHVTFWPNSWVLNLSTLSPTATADVSIGPERWAQYHARHDAHLLDDPVWDGMLIDRGDSDESWLIGNSTARTIDPDQSNTLLSDYTAFDAAWNAGLRQYVAGLRAAVGDEPLLFANWGMANYDLLNGNNFEGFPMDDGTAYGLGWSAAVFGPKEDGAYFDWLSNARQPNMSMIETYEDDSGADPNGDGSYDNPCARPGFVPDYRKMRFGLTTALLNDGFFSYEINTNGHGSLCLLWFDEYDNAGQGRGYLGQPLGPAQRALGELATPNLALGGGMDTPAQLESWSWWTDDGYAGSLALDAAEKVSGAAAARFTITQAGGTNWKAAFSYEPVQINAGADYTLSFWARADAPRPLSAWVQRTSPPWDTWLEFPDVTLTTTWQRYELSLPSEHSDALAGLYFGLGQTTGSVWLDDIRLQTGSREMWRREFSGGVVLVNATSTPQTVNLGAAFAHIFGRQDRLTNNGQVVQQVTLPPLDGLILLRWTPGDKLIYLPGILR